jgi:hypothetical protein
VGALLFLTLLVLVFLWINRGYPAGGNGQEGNLSNAQGQDQRGSDSSNDAKQRSRDSSKLPDRRKKRPKARKNSRSRVAPGGIDSAWGFVVVEDVVGNPKPGDEAYIAELGPDAGLMKIESVSGNRAVLSLGTLPSGTIQEYHSVTTRPASQGKQSAGGK